MADLVNTTRGASYSNFPRNTKERFLRTCAMEAREAEKRQREIEAAYEEYAPVQVFQADAMHEAQQTQEWLDLCAQFGLLGHPEAQ